MNGSLKNIRLIVILLLIVSVAASFLFFHGNTKESTKQNSELASEKDTKSAPEEISKPVELEAVVPFFTFDVNKDTYLISQLDFQDDIKEEVYLSEPQYTSKYFKTLFCYVISPNAP